MLSSVFKTVNAENRLCYLWFWFKKFGICPEHISIVDLDI